VTTEELSTAQIPLAALVGADVQVPCLDGSQRPYRDLDCAASTPALVTVAERVGNFLPMYSSVHRGAGYKSRMATDAYEQARATTLEFCGRSADGEDVAIMVRNTTEAINHLAYRLRLEPGDVVATTVVEHHANLLPWARVAERRFVECGTDGMFETAAVLAALDQKPRPKVLAITAASNVTGWLPPIDEIVGQAHDRGVLVALDAAQLAPHRPIPRGADFVSFSGHKLYAPFGAGALVGQRSLFMTGDPFLAGGGAVDLVDLDEVIWTDPPEREEAGSPNVVGAVAFAAAMAELRRVGWGTLATHEATLATRLKVGLAAIDGVRLLGPGPSIDTLAVASFTVEGLHHALVAARLSAEWGIGVRHGCFCAHPYLLRLLGLGATEIAEARQHILGGDRRQIPGAIRASCGIGTTTADVDALVAAVAELAGGIPAPVDYVQDPVTGDYWPVTGSPGWTDHDRPEGAGCGRG